MTGYDRLSALIARYPELAMYRRFSGLCTENLLYLQAELSHLEAALREIRQTHSLHHSRDEKELSTSWKEVITDNDGIDEPGKEWIYLEIRSKLEEYYKALARARMIHSLRKPRRCDLAFLRDWLGHPGGGDFFLEGVEANTWEPENAADLGSLFDSADAADGLLDWLYDTIIPWYHRWIGRKVHQPDRSHDEWKIVQEYRKSKLVLVGNALSMSFVFSFIMTVVVQGRRVDVFAATTAFAAVQVVFIGGSDILSAP